MFVSTADLEAFTGLSQPSAQARFLDKLGICYVRRQDGSIALRQAELDAHTLSRPALVSAPVPKRESRLHLPDDDSPRSPNDRRWPAKREKSERK